MAKPSKPKIDGLEDLDNCTCQNLRQATRVVTQFYETALDPTGLKITQLPVLAAAATHGPVLMSRLADILVMDRTTLTRNLQPLIRAGLVAIEKGDDKRARLVTATDKGVKTLKDALPIWRKTQEEMVDALGRFQWGVLMDNLRATVAAAQEQGAE